MAYVYLNDGGPEAEEYESNYYYFDDSNPDAMAAIERMLTSDVPRDSAFRSEFEKICRASFDKPAKRKSKNHVRLWVAGMIQAIAQKPFAAPPALG